jgi:hypothetical protein
MEAPTMKGFTWSPRWIDPSHRILPGDHWCVRDAFCALLDWDPGSEEWDIFIEAPSPDDMDPLIEHLGLAWFDPEYEPHWQALQSRLDHPGISFYNFHTLKISHCMFQPHLRHLRGLANEYQRCNPELFRLVVDIRQPPRAAP